MSKKILKHIGIIGDGNRRWARERGLPTLEGHRQGFQKMKDIGRWCLKRGIKILTFFAFSTENWNRSKEEVGYLMWLLKMAMTKDIYELKKDGIKLKVIGNIDELSKDLQEAIKRAEEITKNNKKGILNIAINYGGRPEIVYAVKKIIEQKIPSKRITEKVVNNNLYTAGLPDPDLIIRTSGEQRLSGFLLWQSAYSELYFITKYWPDFEEKDLDEVIREYSRRERRFGK
jgi:undecaprenyl diphosphate synthase